MSVDFPDPDGPMIAQYSPCWMLMERPRSAWISSSPITYVFHRSWVTIMSISGISTRKGAAGSRSGLVHFPRLDQGPDRCRSIRGKQRFPVSHIDGHEHGAGGAGPPALLADRGRQVLRRRQPRTHQEDAQGRVGDLAPDRIRPHVGDRLSIDERHQLAEQAHSLV